MPAQLHFRSKSKTAKLAIIDCANMCEPLVQAGDLTRKVKALRFVDRLMKVSARILIGVFR